MSKIVILQRDVPAWTEASWFDARKAVMPRIEEFCNGRFSNDWDYWDLNTEEIWYEMVTMQIPHAIKFERDEDATVFLLGFK